MDFLVLQIIDLTTTTCLLSLEQPTECQEQTDEQIQEQIDMHGTYWLDECKYILTIMVHRKNPRFTGEVADLPVGPSRKELRQMAKHEGWQ
jgi:hypothetical protein